jgi:flavodoxin
MISVRSRIDGQTSCKKRIKPKKDRENNMKGIILYMSRAGSTKEYAEMLSEETGFPILDLKNDKKPDLEGYEIVIIGSWIMGNRMVARSWIRKKWKILEKRHVILFSTSGAEPDIEIRKEFLEGSLPSEIRDQVSYFPLRGRFRKEDLGPVYKGFMGLAEKLFKNDELVKDLSEGVDGVEREKLMPMIEMVGKIEISQENRK